ncbi:conjugative transposon protein TraM [Sediminibacterium sp.]|uniref:conjugative transposon protein TraM n=1 Tax=Sediminibacterium sp. TaxID=1917865 RepID=UPI003F69F3D4
MKKIKSKLVLVAIVIPFLVLIVWLLLGLGSDKGVGAPKQKGLNTQLPGVHGDPDSAKDKMSFYAVAQMDSVKRKEALAMDPYRNIVVAVEDEYEEVIPVTNLCKKNWSVQRKLVEYEVKEKVISNPVAEPTIVKIDPEIEAINATLDKIRELQQPVDKTLSVTEISAPIKARKVMDVSVGEKEAVTYFGKAHIVSGAGFYNGNALAALPDKAIKACIKTSQVVQPGSTVRMELTSSIQINGIEVPAGTGLSGIATIDAERLQIHIPSILAGNQLLPVALSVYDLDGLQGIYVPGSLSREVAKQSADNAIQSVGIGGLDASIKTQAVSAGIGAAKKLFSGKIKVVRVNLTAGYQVLLRDNNSNSSR